MSTNDKQGPHYVRGTVGAIAGYKLAEAGLHAVLDNAVQKKGMRVDDVCDGSHNYPHNMDCEYHRVRVEHGAPMSEYALSAAHTLHQGVGCLGIIPGLLVGAFCAYLFGKKK